MNTIAPLELQERLAADETIAVLDVRTPAEFGAAHVPQARNIPLDTLDPKALYAAGTLTKAQPVYLLCQGGGRATMAAQKFTDQGFDEAVIVEGGTQAWTTAGLPLTRAKRS